MRIKRIEIIGFKSFCDKTVLQIHEPITAVVGPNGCGKSNVVDAIRWCMGEQSAKHLRGGKMEDVIFAGSETRGPAGMAEVSLTFQNVGFASTTKQSSALDLVDQDALPEDRATPLGAEEREASPGDGLAGSAVAEAVAVLRDEPSPIDLAQYGEVTVTRRLFRDGTSEYFINKTPCRLRDITDFFLGTGVGTKAYSIIEQGRIGQIVSAKPEDRRLIIEEAAGITKFKKKKILAERKMEQTRQNLLRVSDIVQEIEKQLGSLRRQAQKAERYKKYRAEMRDIELWSASHRFLGLDAESRWSQGIHAGLAQRRDEAQADHERREAGMIAERAECSLEERRLTDLTQAVYDLENRLKLGESQVAFHQREAEDLERQVKSSGSEIEVINRQSEETALELSRVRAEGARLEGDAGTHVEELARFEEAQRVARNALDDAQGDLDSARGEIAKAQADIARAEGNIRSLDRRRGDLEARLHRITDEDTRLHARQEEVLPDIATLEEKLHALRQLKLDLGQQKESLETRQVELRERQAKGEAEVETLRTELHRRKSRLVSLREIQDRYEGLARGTRAVMQHRPGDDGEGKRIRGLVADIVEAPAEIEQAVEAVLGDRLGSILVESKEVGLQAVQFLKNRAEGRSSFIPVSSFAPTSGARTVGSTSGIEVVEAEGVRGEMLGLIHAREEYGPIAEYLFKDVVLVESLPRALELWDAGLRKTMVTLDGDLVDPHGVVTGGSRETAGAGILQQKREIRELEQITGGLEQDLADATARHVTCKAELAQVQASLEGIRKESHQGEIAMLAHEKDLSRWRAEAERLAERLEQLAREKAEIDHGVREMDRELEETQVQLEVARRRTDEAERRQLGLIEGVTVARHALEDASAQLTDCKVRAAKVNAERQGVQAQVRRLEEQARELIRRTERLGRSVEEGGNRFQALREEAARIAETLVAVREERRARAEELGSGRTAYEHRMAALQVAEVEAKRVRQDVDRLKGETSRLEMKLHDFAAERRHLEESIFERYRVELNRVVTDFHLRPAVSDVEEARLRELRDLIDRMGEVNLTAIQEFEELSRRHEFLVTQKKDLESALDQLERAIGKINRASRALFRETFDAVNAKFQEIFPRLFRGGHAELRLSGGEGDLLDAGVEIIAQPPGKKNTSVELLSGGEKALTAVSLIFAIFLVKPSPFCLLDEVDAPLDEANVGRYNEMVRALTDRSQFIVITHNKRTMGVADTLHGITMEEPGCSKLVSVNLRSFGKAA